MPYINLDDVNLYYERYGTGKPILFLHGLGSSLEDWEFQRDYFSENYEVILIDLRGHGRSTCSLNQIPNNDLVNILSADIQSFISKLDLQNLRLVGVSLGGMVALEVATAIPERCRSVAVINTICDLRPRTIRDHTIIISRKIMIKYLGMKFFAHFMAKKLFPKTTQQGLRKRVINRLVANNRELYLKLFRSMIGWNILDRLAKINLPILFVSGDRDYTPFLYKQECAALTQNGKAVLIRDSGHASPIDQPMELNNVLNKFYSCYTDKQIQFSKSIL